MCIRDSGNQAGHRVTGDNNVMLTPNGGTNAVSLSDRFAVYKDDELDSASGTPLLFGDISNKILCINTRNTSMSSSSVTGTKLIINGGVVANGYTPFTGLHNISLNSSINTNNLEEGMIVSTTGSVVKSHLIDVKAEVVLSSTPNDKKVYGVYSNSETIEDTSCLLYTSPSPRDRTRSRMPSSA